MKQRWLSLILTSSFALVLAHLLSNNNVPPGFSQPWKLKLIMLPMNIIFTLSDMAGYLYGIEYKVRTLRFIMTKMARRRLQGNTTHIQVYSDVFSGVPVRIYCPTDGTSDQGIIYFHGGGWVYGGLDSYDGLARHLAQKLHKTLVLVGYRLAPEHPYPGPLEDCITATRHVMEHAATLKLNPRHLIIAGDSAGGNLAAAVALRMRDEGYPYQPRKQILVNPSLQPVNFQTPSYLENYNNAIWSKAQQVQSWLLYAVGNAAFQQNFLQWHNCTSEQLNPLQELSPCLGDAPSASRNPQWQALTSILRDSYFSPLLASRMDNLPDSLVITMEHDIVRDEGMWYAQRLRAAGNRVRHLHLDQGFHGLILFQEFREASELVMDIAQFVNEND